MSFQLIHTSYPHLLDSAASGYGTVARSEEMPKQLITRLNAMSILREPGGGSCTSGPQFSYHIINIGSSVWHVLTCVQTAGADYSGRACHTAHHLVLSQQEVTRLLTNEIRPTPAGVSLALHRSGFWIQKWQGEPRFLIGEPPLCSEHFPDASVQPTWKHLTGHKSNARAFYTPPYDRECMVTVPGGTPSLEVLGLFHESDWLTPGLGWGCTYTTETDDADSFAETLRMVVAEDSPLVRRAVRTGHPVLRITADMELAVKPAQGRSPHNTTSGSRESDVQNSASACENVARVLPRSLSHYHYTEDPDWMLYDVAMPRSNPYVLPLAIFGAATLLTGISCGIWLGLSQPVQMLDSYLNDTITSNLNNDASSVLDKLTALITAPYNHESTVHTLKELMLIPETAPEDALIMECAVLLSHISEDGVNHAAALKRICECARMLQLPANALERLYMSEVVHTLTPDEWHERISYQSTDEWLSLKRNEPEFFSLFAEGRFMSYEPGLHADSTPHTELATADIAQTPERKEEASTNENLQVIGAHPAICGQQIPAILTQITSKLPLTISSGSYSVSFMRKGGTLQTAASIKLGQDGYHLCISPTDKEGEFRIRPEHKDGKKADVPEITLIIRNNKLQKIKCKDGEAVVAFPVPGGNNSLTYVILAPRIAIPIPTPPPFSFPSAEEISFDITQEKLSVSAPSANSPTYRLSFKKKEKNFPWVLNSKQTEYVRFSINLPTILERHPNNILETSDESTTYMWKKVDIRGEVLDCEIEHKPNLPGRLDYVFEQIANAPCCGDDSIKNKNLNLAHLYFIAQKLSDMELKKSTREKLCDEYIAMLAHRKFNAELRKIMRSTPILLLSADDASSRIGSAGRMRNDLKKTLLHSAAAQHILLHVCRVLSDSLREAYKQEIKDFEEAQKKRLLLVLKKLSIGADGELNWHFHLQTGK